MIKKSDNLIIIGPSGSGKGTQAEFISKTYAQKHLVMGEILREMTKNDDSLARQISETINKGRWVSDNLVNKAITEVIKQISNDKGIILDGYPRTVAQAECLKKLYLKVDRSQPVVINLIVKPESVVYRLLNRKVCDKCGRLFHPPESLSEVKCKKCGGKLIRREDDTEEVIKKRLSEFNKKAEKVIDYYRQDKKVIDIDGEPKITEVSRQIKEKLDNYE